MRSLGAMPRIAAEVHNHGCCIHRQQAAETVQDIYVFPFRGYPDSDIVGAEFEALKISYTVRWNSDRLGYGDNCKTR